MSPGRGLARASAALLVLAAAQAAPAQNRAERQCLFERTDYCRQVQERREARAYGLASVRRLARDGLQIHRLLIFNAYYGDVGALTFTRRGSEPPRVEFRLPYHRDLQRSPLSAEIPVAAWDEMAAESRAFDEGRRFARQEPDSICLDPWIYQLESADPPAPGARAASRFRAVDECSGPYHPYWLAEHAASLLPGCMALDAQENGLAYERLINCTKLEGDRAAAALAANVVDSLTDLPDAPDGAAIMRAAFAAEVSLDWEGVRTEGGEAAAAAWLRGLAANHDARFYWLRVTGLSPDRASAEGRLRADVEGVPDNVHDDYYLYAPVNLVLARVADGRFVIVRIAVGAFTRVRD